MLLASSYAEQISKVIMDMMARCVLLLLIVLMLSEFVHANDLIDLYHLAQSNDSTLHAALYTRDVNIEARPQALSGLLPKLTAAASIARENENNAVLSGVPAAGSGCTVAVNTSSERCYGSTRAVGLSLSQPLWSYVVFNQLKEANLQKAAAETNWQGAQQALLLRLAQIYFAILSASDQLDTSRKEREAFDTLLNQAKVLAQTGVGPRSDVDLAQSYYDDTEQSVIDAQNLLDNNYLALTEIVGPHDDQYAPLRDDIQLSALQPASVNEWVSDALQNNYDLRTARLQVQSADRDIAVQRSRGLPTLSLTAASYRYNQDVLLGGNQTINTVGVGFNWPLYQGGAIASAIRESRAQYYLKKAQYDLLGRDVERLTRANYRDIVTGPQRIAAAQRAVTSGRNAVSACRHNIEFGTGSEFELLNAQNNYFNALRAYNQVRYDYLTSLLTLKQLAGRLSEADLVMIDQLLVVKSP